MGRHPFEQAKTDLQQLLRRTSLEAFVLQILSKKFAISHWNKRAPFQPAGNPSSIDRSTYIDLKILVYLHELPEDGNKLHEVRELPAIPEPMEQARLLRLGWGRRGRVDIGAGTLSRDHIGGRAPQSAMANLATPFFLSLCFFGRPFFLLIIYIIIIFSDRK